MDKENTFNYTYSAQQQAEIEEIRKKYLPPEEDKMGQLRRLDQQVTQKAQAGSISAGVSGALLLGTGMSLILTELGIPLGSAAMPLGILLGLVGLALVIAAYPLYRLIVKAERKRVAPEILRLSEELLK